MASENFINGKSKTSKNVVIWRLGFGSLNGQEIKFPLIGYSIKEKGLKYKNKMGKFFFQASNRNDYLFSSDKGLCKSSKDNSLNQR